MTLKHCLTIAVMCAATARAADAPSTTAEIAALKQELQEQRQQIAELRAAIAEQHRILETISTPRATSPTIEPIRFTSPVPSAAPQPSTASEKASPLQVQIGSAYITPVGFMDFTSVTRSRNTGAGIGSSFGGVPFKNTVQGNLPETRFSAQNSRIGFRADAIVKGAHVIGYLESDFLGFVPANAAVTTNGVSNRMRLYWADVRMGKVEFLAGQSWTMLTPNRKGISAIPSDLFYSQDVDVNYQAGLTWSRDPGFRILYHPTETATLGLSFENPEQYIGGSSGASLVTLPSALSTQYALQLNNGNTTLSAPALHPDIIAKIAFDPKLPSGRALHFEIAGVERTFHVYNQTLDRHFTTAGGAGSINVNFEIVKNLRLLTNNYYGSGGGRYIFGQAPDLIVRSDGSLSPIHSGSTVSGFEWQRANTLLYSYYGGIYIRRNTTIDPATGRPVGYGYTGSQSAQNRTIQEATFGITQTFWRDARFGALQLMSQYSFLQRNPWFVAAGTPSEAHTHMFFLNLRYTLPGRPPDLK